MTTPAATPPARVYLVLAQPSTTGFLGWQVFLAQKNLYVAPTTSHEVAFIAHHAAQWVVPSTLVPTGGDAVALLVQSMTATLGVTIDPTTVVPLPTTASGPTVYMSQIPAGSLPTDPIVDAITSGTVKTPIYASVRYVELEQAMATIGPQPMVTAVLPWVTAQLQRALAAGFQNSMIKARLIDPANQYALTIAQVVMKLCTVAVTAQGDGSLT